MGGKSIRALGIAAIFLSLPQFAHSANLTFDTIADTSTLAPGTSDAFTNLSPPVLRKNAQGAPPAELSFAASSASGRQGVYAMNYAPPTKTLTTLADTSTAMPGFSVNFGQFISLSGGEQSYFTAIGSDGTSTALYYAQPNDSRSPHELLKQGSVVGGQTIQSFGDVSVVGGPSDILLAVAVYVQTNIGIVQAYVSTSFPGVVVNSTSLVTTSPGLHNIGMLNSATTLGQSPSWVDFTAEDSTGAPGIYEGGSQAFKQVVGTSTTIPNGHGTFTDFGNPSVNATWVSFEGIGNQQQGIYRWTRNNSTLTRVVDLTMPVPGGNGATFTSFGDASAGASFPQGDKSVPFDAFTATTSNGSEGIYYGDGAGDLFKLIDTTDTLNGKTPVDFELSSDAFESNLLFFKATFSDGSEGIYVGSVLAPEPGIALVSIAISGLFLQRRGSMAR